MEILEERQVGLGLRAPKLGREAGVGLAGTPEATASPLPACEQGAIGPIPQVL